MTIDQLENIYKALEHGAVEIEHLIKHVVYAGEDESELDKKLAEIRWAQGVVAVFTDKARRKLATPRRAVK